MNILRRLSTVTTAGVMAFSAMLSLGIPSVAYAAAQTCTWTGTAGDNKFSTATNWSGCNGAAPLEGDVISFDASATTFSSSTEPTVPLTNDLNVALGGVTLIGKTEWGGAGGVLLSSLKLSDGGTITFVPDATKYKSFDLGIGIDALAELTGSGSATIRMSDASANMPHMTYGGISGIETLSVLGKTSGYLLPILIGSQTSSLTKLVLENAVVETYAGQDLTISTNIEATNSSLRYVAFEPGSSTLTMTGSVTLQGDLMVAVYEGYTVKVTGAVSGGQIKKSSDATGTLMVGTETVVPPVKITDYTDSKDTEAISVSQNETAILAAGAVRSSAQVYKDGTLKGLGSFKYGIIVGQGGSIAPGMSPGCMSADSLRLRGKYLFEIGGAVACDRYDQMKLLGQSLASNQSAVSIDAENATLNTSLYDNYVPKSGEVYVVIDNQSNGEVKGAFKDMPEGATFTQNGVVFKISYVGGDGNDVTLTVQNAPTTPDTGLSFATSSPVIVLVAMTALSVGIALTARRLSTVKTKR